MSIEKITSDIPDIRAGSGLDDKEKARLQKAVKDFEALFIGYMLKSMRSSIPESNLFGNNFGGDVLEGLFDLEFSQHLSQNSNFGIGAMMYRQLTGEDLPKNTRKLPRTMPLSSVVKKNPVGYGVKTGTPVRNTSTLSQRLMQYDKYIAEAAHKYNVDSNLIKAVIVAESAAQPDALSPKQAKGLMQLIDSTAAEMGVKNIWNPRENILGGTRYLKQMLNRFNGDVALALASYNAGPGAVDRHRGVPPFQETRNYIQRVQQYYKHYQNEEITSYGDNFTTEGNNED